MLNDTSKRLLAALAGVFLTLGGATASATIMDPEVRVDVTYTDGSIADEPLSLGLVGALPAEVNAMFLLGAPAMAPEPGEPTEYGLYDVFSAELSFGDGTWTILDSFKMEVDAGGIITDLEYEFLPIDTLTATNVIALNFPLEITGTDIESGENFEYKYTSSRQSISSIPEPGTLALLSLGLVGLGVARHKKKT